MCFVFTVVLVNGTLYFYVKMTQPLTPLMLERHSGLVQGGSEGLSCIVGCRFRLGVGGVEGG